MEPKQTAQMVAWLDEERRKDKALIMKLEERSAAQSTLIDEQTRRIQSMEAEFASLRTTALSINLFDEAVARLRNEISASLEQIQRTTTGEETKRVRELVREGTTKVIDDLRQEIVTRLERELQSRRAEEDRLSRIAVELQTYADALRKDFEEFQRTVSFLEEQRRIDSRRIADVQSESTEVVKRMESQQTKMELLEDITRRNERALTESLGTITEIKQQRQVAMEKEALAEKEREKVIGDALRRLEDNLKTWSKQAEGWTDTQRNLKKYTDDFTRLVERVERQLNEVSETQRISEERFRHEWEEFQQEDQKRFRQFTLTNEEAWRESDKLTKSMSEQLARLTERSDQLTDHVRQMSATQRDAFEALTAYLASLREQAEKLKPLT